MTFDFNLFDKGIRGWLESGTCLLHRKGSHAYGMNTEHSDVDLAGICIPPKEYFNGFHKKFEQAELKAPNPDTTIYEIRKFFNLAAQCNPNIMDTLFCDESDILSINKFGKKIRDNAHKFLSKKARFTYSGYSFSQLKRIKGHRNYILNPPTHKPTRAEFGLPEETVIPRDQLEAAASSIRKELDRLHTMECLDHLEESDKINIQNSMVEVMAKLQITADSEWESAGRLVGLNENFLEMMKREREYSTKKTEWKQYQNWRENRNPARYELEEKYLMDTKHAAHLVRLMRMCREILTTGQVLVKRPDAEELLAIRNGAWTYEQVIEFAEREEAEMEGLYKASTLPHSPDIKFLDNLCQEIVEEYLYCLN